MLKFVIAVVLALTAMAGFSGTACAADVPDSVVGTWVYRDYDRITKMDTEKGYTTKWTIKKDGSATSEDGATGTVTTAEASKIVIEFTNGEYKGTIEWDPRTNRGETNFTGAPGNSSKKTNPALTTLP